MKHHFLLPKRQEVRAYYGYASAGRIKFMKFCLTRFAGDAIRTSAADITFGPGDGIAERKAFAQEDLFCTDDQFEVGNMTEHSELLE